MLRGSLEGARPVAEVVVVNNLSDVSVEGMAILTASNGISFGPQQVYFNIQPGKQHVESIEVAFTPEAGDDRALAVEASFERQTYRDVLTTANPGLCSVTLTRTGAQLRAEIRNGGSIHAEGSADLIAGPAHWPELGGTEQTTVTPARLPVSVPPYKAQTVSFSLSDPDASPELCLRLSVNGRVQYHYFDRNAPERRDAPVIEAPNTTSPPPRGTSAPTPPPPRGRAQGQP